MAGGFGMYARNFLAGQGRYIPDTEKKAPAASEGEDGAVCPACKMPRRDAGLRPVEMCACATLTAAPTAQAADESSASPKHDERSEAFTMLVAVARAAHRAMDSGEEFADHRVMLEASGATELAHALDAMDALPDVPDPNYVYDGWARAEYFATQPAARRVTKEDVDRARVAYLGVGFHRSLNECLRAALESFAQPQSVPDEGNASVPAERDKLEALRGQMNGLLNTCVDVIEEGLCASQSYDYRARAQRCAQQIKEVLTEENKS